MGVLQEFSQDLVILLTNRRSACKLFIFKSVVVDKPWQISQLHFQHSSNAPNRYILQSIRITSKTKFLYLECGSFGNLSAFKLGTH